MHLALASPFEVKHDDEEERGFRPNFMFAVSHDRPIAKALQLPAHMQEAKNNKGREEERLVMLVVR